MINRATVFVQNSLSCLGIGNIKPNIIDHVTVIASVIRCAREFIDKSLRRFLVAVTKAIKIDLDIGFYARKTTLDDLDRLMLVDLEIPPIRLKLRLTHIRILDERA